MHNWLDLAEDSCRRNPAQTGTGTGKGSLVLIELRRYGPRLPGTCWIDSIDSSFIRPSFHVISMIS
jgi:hypothetical protein